MSQGMNKAILIGNIGQDPELKYTQAGQAVLRLRIATNESYVDKSGTKKDLTEWHTVVIWGKRAEGLNKILSKGRQLCIEGRIQTRSWEDKDGGKRYATEINAQNVVLVGGGGGGGGGRSQPRGDSNSSGDADGEFGGHDGPDYGGDDDIPF